MSYPFPAHDVVVIPIADSGELFPVRRIYCVGRNYAAHAREMGHGTSLAPASNPNRDAPLFFCKPADALVVVAADEIGTFHYPDQSSDVQYEVELVVAIGTAGRNIEVDDAPNHIFGYAVGFDMTRRDLHREMQSKSHPWEIAKSFDDSAPISLIHRVATLSGLESAAIRLEVNAQLKQKGVLSDMIWSVPQIIGHLSRFFELMPGDLIYTGTPEGVGPVARGDELYAVIDGVDELRLVVR